MLTAEMRTPLLECLRLPDRAWTCAQLAEVVHQQYGVAVYIETVRQFLRRAGVEAGLEALAARGGDWRRVRDCAAVAVLGIAA